MKNNNETIRKIVSYLNNAEENGGFWLPNIQRPFVWNEEQIERLFDSLMREYPISTLLVWRTKSKIRHRKFIDNYTTSRKLSDFYMPENDKPKYLVLDGQQRLQSLYIGLKGSYEKKELYIDILSGELKAPEDIRFRFKFLNKDIVNFPWVKVKDIVLSDSRDREISKKIISELREEITDIQKDTLEDNVNKILHVFRTNEVVVYQELDSIDRPDAYTENDVVEIFIRANSGGTILGKSDLLFSLLTSSWEDAEENMDILLDEVNKTGYKFTRDFVLKTCLTLLDKGARYDVKKFRDGKTKEAINTNWDSISSSIKDVKDTLFGKTFLRTHRAIPSYLGIIPIIYYRYKYPDDWCDLKNLDEYILRTLLTGSFSGTPDNLIDKVIKRIDEEKAFNVPSIFNVIRADGRNLDITKDAILNLSYGSKLIHLIFNIWYREFNYMPSYINNMPQVDHIFPQSELKKIKIINPESGKKNLLKYKANFRDQIANCMLLSAKENGAGGKSAILPEIWFADKSEEYFDMHLIPKNKELWKIENFDSFIEARKSLILEKFQFLILEERL